MGSTKGHELGQLFEINNLSTDHFTKKKKKILEIRKTCNKN